MGRGSGGSTLSNLASRRAALNKTRQALNPDTERGGPQAPTRANPSPPPVPAQQIQAPERRAGEVRQQMLNEAGDFLQDQGAKRRGQAPREAQPAVSGAQTTRPSAADTLVDRVESLGATKRPVETQFFRLAGREGTPRELSVFRARLEIERQLNRVPTETELLMFMARPRNFPALTQQAIEPSPQGAELGPAPTGAQ